MKKASNGRRMLGKTSIHCRSSSLVASFEARKKAELERRNVPVELQELVGILKPKWVPDWPI